MAKGKVITTSTDLDAAFARAATLKDEPRATSVVYRAGAGLDLFVVTLSDGRRLALPRESLQGLRKASKANLSNITIVGKGTGLWWPALDLGHYLPSLLKGIYGSKQWMTELKRGYKGNRKSPMTSAAESSRPKRVATAA